MTNDEKRLYLINYLLSERKGYEEISVPKDATEQRRLLRSLMNVRPPAAAEDEFLKIQNEYLKDVIAEKGITRLSEIKPISERLCLWQGDITTLECDAIVNAANSGMTGCYHPLHCCIDNCIHTYSGVQLRYECGKIMEKQGFEEPTGKAKITAAYNLPCKYVIHTVGPIVRVKPTRDNAEKLASSYLSCLKLAKERGLKSIAFPCISTGVFGYPKEDAAKIAVETVKSFLKDDDTFEKVIFNVFTDEDKSIYERIFAGD